MNSSTLKSESREQETAALNGWFALFLNLAWLIGGGVWIGFAAGSRGDPHWWLIPLIRSYSLTTVLAPASAIGKPSAASHKRVKVMLRMELTAKAGKRKGITHSCHTLLTASLRSSRLRVFPVHLLGILSTLRMPSLIRTSLKLMSRPSGSFINFR